MPAVNEKKTIAGKFYPVVRRPMLIANLLVAAWTKVDIELEGLTMSDVFHSPAEVMARPHRVMGHKLCNMAMWSGALTLNFVSAIPPNCGPKPVTTPPHLVGIYPLGLLVPTFGNPL